MRTKGELILLAVVLTFSWIICIVATVAWHMPGWGVLPLGLFIGLAAGDTHRLVRKRRERRDRS